MRYFCLVFFCLFFFACSVIKPRAFAYDLNITSQSFNIPTAKFISYKDVLFHFGCSRFESSKYNVRKDSVVSFYRLDTVDKWIIDTRRSIYYILDTFDISFSILNSDSLKRKMVGGFSDPYKYEKPLYDTLINGITYHVSDSIVRNTSDNIDFRFYFIKNKNLHTVYSILKNEYKDPEYKYAGFTMDDYKYNYFFVGRIENYKEVTDPATLQKLEAIYQRFKRLQRGG
jgi:hypothetical protein